MKKTPLPKHGCFTVKYPSTQWQEQPCTKAPNIPYVPQAGSIPQSVGAHYDFVAEATAGLLSEAEGSFPASNGVISESGYRNNYPPDNPNTFTLQLNSEYFYNAPPCADAAIPSQCQGWEQFLFQESDGGNAKVYIQNWLLNYATLCPAGWEPYLANCYLNSPAVSVPSQQAVNVPSMTLTGEAANATETVIFSAPGDTLSAVSQNTVLSLEQHWTAAEFNVFGDGGGSEANFNSGSTLFVQTSVTNGTTNAPVCLGPQGAGTTGESNNLNLIPQSAPVCCPYGGTYPSILFMESNVTNAPTAACGALPYSANGSMTTITHPIILGEIRVLYSATLEDSTPGASITYQLFDSCGNSVESSTVSAGTMISYLDTEINGESCTYGIRGTMYATAPGYVPTAKTAIAF